MSHILHFTVESDLFLSSETRQSVQSDSTCTAWEYEDDKGKNLLAVYVGALHISHGNYRECNWTPARPKICT